MIIRAVDMRTIVTGSGANQTGAGGGFGGGGGGLGGGGVNVGAVVLLHWEQPSILRQRSCLKVRFWM